MNLKAINKWLDEEYGCSYTRLEELHDFYFEKYSDLQQENKQLKETINKIYELIKQHIRKDEFLELNEWQTRDLLNLLKEVSK